MRLLLLVALISWSPDEAEDLERCPAVGAVCEAVRDAGVGD